MKIDNIATHSVKVNGGSGCLFNGASADYTYVLTCAHNLNGNEAPAVITHHLGEEDQLVETELEVLAPPFIHSNPEKDAAIIKVKYIENPIQLLTVNNPAEVEEPLKLAGYPSIRREKEYQFRLNDIKIDQSGLHGYLEATVSGNATQEEIMGQSGGGIFFIDGERLFVAGVQSKMAAGDDEGMGRIEFMPISFFTEIIAEHPDDLRELLPHYLYSFSFLKLQVMKLEGCILEQNIDFTRSYLQRIAQEIVESPLTPLQIRDAFKERLIVHKEADHCLSEKGIWIAWLEFLIIMRIILDKHVSSAEIEDVFNSYRLIFSNTDGDWTRELANIMRSDYKGLKKDGKIIISTKNPPRVHAYIPEGMIPNLDRASNVQSGEFKIDDGIGHPFKAYRLYHLHAFQKHGILEKEISYGNFSALSEDELLATLKTEFNALFQQR